MPVLVSDLDGTLLDIKDRFAYSQVAALAQLGYDVTLEQIYPFIRYTLDAEKFLSSLNIFLSSSELFQYIKEIEKAFYINWQTSQLFPGVIDALNVIRTRVQALRLITSRAKVEETRQEVQAFGLDKIFNHHVYTRGDLALLEGIDEFPLYPFDAHRQRLIQLAISDIENPDQVWIVGDSPEEMKAAKGLDYITVGVLTGFFTKQDLEPFADYILDSVANISKLL